MDSTQERLKLLLTIYFHLAILINTISSQSLFGGKNSINNVKSKGGSCVLHYSCKSEYGCQEDSCCDWQDKTVVVDRVMKRNMKLCKQNQGFYNVPQS